MHCFELKEDVQEGLLVHFPHLTVGWSGGSSFRRIRLCSETMSWLNTHVGSPKPQDRLLFKRADLRTQPAGERGGRPSLQLTTATKPDRRAMVLVRSAAGPGGKVKIITNRWVKVVAKGDYQGSTEKLLIVLPDGIIQVMRSGELEGAWPEYILGWDGQKMHRLDKHILR